jgi:hypothetical protein
MGYGPTQQIFINGFFQTRPRNVRYVSIPKGSLFFSLQIKMTIIIFFRMELFLGKNESLYDPMIP